MKLIVLAERGKPEYSEKIIFWTRRERNHATLRDKNGTGTTLMEWCSFNTTPTQLSAEGGWGYHNLLDFLSFPTFGCCLKVDISLVEKNM